MQTVLCSFSAASVDNTQLITVLWLPGGFADGARALPAAV